MDPKKIIESLGGTSKVAGMCDITPQAVSQWKENGIPKPWLLYLRLKKPKVFSALSAEKENEQAA